MQSENHFELRAQLMSVDQANSSSHFYELVDDNAMPMGLQIWVDGLQLEEGVAIDFLGLLDTTHKLKQSVWKPYWQPNIFSCGCGTPGCAGMSHGIQVSHDGAHVVWTASLPLVIRRRNAEPPHGVNTTYRFLKSQMIEQCQRFVKTARTMSGGKLSNVRVPVYNQSLDVLLRKSRFKWARRGTTK